ncbi:MAG: hypothetical protein P4L31_03435 [Candidatus Babeliales bacterium]|nr:hypothetical protein [Candidatus Babeliales bacterium]
MEALRILEEKIASLVAVIHDFKAKNEALKAENCQAQAEVKESKAENAVLLEENAKLLAKLNVMENSVLKGNEHMEETKIVVDDLIRSIDALVGNEHQQ